MLSRERIRPLNSACMSCAWGEKRAPCSINITTENNLKIYFPSHTYENATFLSNLHHQESSNVTHHHLHNINNTNTSSQGINKRLSCKTVKQCSQYFSIIWLNIHGSPWIWNSTRYEIVDVSAERIFSLLLFATGHKSLNNHVCKDGQSAAVSSCYTWKILPSYSRCSFWIWIPTYGHSPTQKSWFWGG